VLVNHVRETEHVRRVATRVVGADHVRKALPVHPPLMRLRTFDRPSGPSPSLGLQVTEGDLPIMGAEDFAYYVQERPGCFFFLGGKEAGRSNAMCHSTQYDYNDSILPVAISMWVRLAEDRLGATLYA
jgi:metal-dependent amidase/aminoacylase/carboxypeptidase family protein